MYNSYSSRSNTYKPKDDSRYRSRSREKRDRSNDSRRRSRSDSPRDRNKYKRRQRSRSKERHRGSPIAELRTKIEVGSGTVKSEIKNHFRFDGIKIGIGHETELIQKLKAYFQEQFGPVVHLTKSTDNQPGLLILELGFQTDYSAEKALRGGIDKLVISIYDKTVLISAKPTSIFQVWLKLQKKKLSKRESSSSRSSDHKKSKKQKHKKKRRRNSKSQPLSNSSSSSSRSSSSGRSRKHRRRSNERSTYSQKFQTSRERPLSYYKTRDNQEKKDTKNEDFHEKAISYEFSTKQSATRVQIGINKKTKQQDQIFKTVLFWGLHITLSAKDVDLYLQKHRDGPFVSKKELIWKKLEGFPACYVLQGDFQQKMAQKLLLIGGTLEIKDYPFIAIDCEISDRQKIIQKISEFQINIKLPIVVEPYYLLKSLNKCGNVIQIVSNNEFTDSGLSDYFNVTFASKKNCRVFKSIKKTSKGIQIYEVSSEDKFVPVYRPTPTTQLALKKQFSTSRKSEGELDSIIQSLKHSPIFSCHEEY